MDDDEETTNARDLLAAIVESSADAIFTKTLGGMVTSWNDGAERLYGYHAGEMVGRSVSVLYPADQSAEERRVLAAVGRGERVAHYETRRVRRDGTLVDVSVSVSPVRDAAGRVTGAATIARDISHQRRAEARFRGLLEAAPDAMIGVDDRGVIVLANSQAETLFGYPRDQLLGLLVDDLVPDAAREHHPKHRSRYFAAPATRPMGAAIELAARRKDGREFPAEISLSSLGGDEGRIVTAAIRDVTERRRLAAERDELRARQSERMESLGQLAGGIAHDFNNLLQLILGYSRFVARAVADDPALSGDVAEIVAAAERAATLTRQLLIFGRREVTRPEVLDLGDAVTATEAILRRTLGEHIEVHVDLGERLPSVFADRSQLEQVIVNLAVNARDAMPDGGLLRFRTDRVEAGGRTAVRLTVADTGCGMRPEVRARIFEPFFSTKPKGQGTGLGLATVYAIVAQAGATIDVYSEEGHGTSFKITFPAVADEAPAPASAEVTPPPRGEGRTAVVAEDELAVRDMIARVLTDAGYRVWAAETPEQALAWCRAGTVRPDVLLTDVIMPKMSGRELADAVTAYLPGLPVVYMSGYSHDVIAHQGVLDPGVTLVEKPFTDAEILRAVGAAFTTGAPPA